MPLPKKVFPKKVLIECKLDNGQDEIIEFTYYNTDYGWVISGNNPDRFIARYHTYSECIEYMESGEGKSLYHNQIWHYFF